MGNFNTYLEEFGHLSFKEMPFNEVDALILSQFSYLHFEGLVPGITEERKEVSLFEIASHMKEEIFFADEWFEKDNHIMFDRMLKSSRFGNMSCNYFAEIINEDVETQFCAITCFFPDFLPIVVFRGTDASFIGWREDFNMAFKKPVMGQRLAVLYLSQVGKHIDGEFFVSGHSKGGNLAVYSSMNVEEEIQNRIKRIYSFDGPGFRPEILRSEDYEKIAERIEKYIPQSSLVGMLMESHEEYMVVDSRSIGLLQHNPFSWTVQEASFVRKEEVYKSQQLMNNTLNDWIFKLEEEQLEIFVGTLFHILGSCEENNFFDMADDWIKSMMDMARATKDLDEETRKEIQSILVLLFRTLMDNLKEMQKQVKIPYFS